MDGIIADELAVWVSIYRQLAAKYAVAGSAATIPGQ